MFEDVPELSDPDEIAVYNTVAAYSKEYWRMMTTNTVGLGFDTIASPEIKAMMQRIADENVRIQAGTRGVFHTRISGITVDDDTATAIACDDFREVIPFDPNGTYTPEQVGLDNVAEKLSLVRSASGGWIVLESNPAGTC